MTLVDTQHLTVMTAGCGVPKVLCCKRKTQSPVPDPRELEVITRERDLQDYRGSLPLARRS